MAEVVLVVAEAEEGAAGDDDGIGEEGRNTNGGESGESEVELRGLSVGEAGTVPLAGTADAAAALSG